MAALTAKLHCDNYKTGGGQYERLLCLQSCTVQQLQDWWWAIRTVALPTKLHCAAITRLVVGNSIR